VKRAALAHALFVLLPTLALSVFAWRAADQDYVEGVAAALKPLEAEADGYAQRVKAAIDESHLLAKEAVRRTAEALAAGEGHAVRPVVGFVKDGEWLGFLPDAPPEASANTGGDEARLFELSLRGGESFEYGFKDPARALDAYSFYLPRIRAEPLRARLRLRMARAAFRSGQKDLGAALLEDLPAGAVEDGVPIEILSLLLIKEHGYAPPEAWDEQFERLLIRRGPQMTTPLFAYLVRTYGAGSAELENVVRERQNLEADFNEHRESLLKPPGVHVGLPFTNLFALPSKGGMNAVVAVDFELPAPRIKESVRYALLRPEKTVASEWGARAIRRPIFLDEGQAPVAMAVIDELNFDETLSALSRRRNLLRGLVGLLLTTAALGGIAFLAVLARERALERLRSRFLANVSHELKTPITSIRMFSEMLAEAPHDSDRTRRFGELLQTESLRLSGLIQNVLDFSRPAGSRKSRAHEVVDLEAFLKGIGDGFSVLARQSGVEFTLETAGCGSLRTDARALERILLNLLDNALKYRGKEKPWIHLKAEDYGTRVRISVADNGIGVARADQERVFEEFYRARFEDYAVPGAGLGLAIARKLARELGGEITLESKLGDGSTFTLVLPRYGKESP